MQGWLQATCWARWRAQVYVHRLRRYLGAYLLQLGHVDAIVFSAGIGENSPEIRRRALAGLQARPHAARLHVRAAGRMASSMPRGQGTARQPADAPPGWQAAPCPGARFHAILLAAV